MVEQHGKNYYVQLDKMSKLTHRFLVFYLPSFGHCRISKVSQQLGLNPKIQLFGLKTLLEDKK